MRAVSTTQRYAGEDYGTETAVTTTQESPYANFRQHFEAEPEKKWQVEVLKRLLTFTRLTPGWDSYVGSPMKWDAGLFALGVLDSVMRPRTPIPQTVPSS